MQAVHFGPQLPAASVLAMVKSKKRTIDTVDDEKKFLFIIQVIVAAPFSKICRGNINKNNGRRLEKELAMAFAVPSFK